MFTIPHISQIEAPQIRYYRELLKLNQNYSLQQLKKAFIEFSKKYHPDRNITQNIQYLENRFKDISAAYNILKDPQKVEKINKAFQIKLITKINVGGRIFDPCIFFGIKLFPVGEKFSFNSTTLHKLPGKVEGTITTKKIKEHFTIINSEVFEEETSITDSPEFDIIELIMGGKMKRCEQTLLRKTFLNRKESSFERLPWYIKNLEAFYAFMEYDFYRARELLESAYHMIKNNIITTFRLGLCYEAIAFTKQTNNKPNKKMMKRAIELYREALQIADSRPPEERQECITIRKQLAYAYSFSGNYLFSYLIWRDIKKRRPFSKEAEVNLKNFRLFGILGEKKKLTLPILHLPRKQLKNSE